MSYSNLERKKKVLDMEKEGKGSMINVVIEGMKRKWGGDRDDPVEINVPCDCAFDEIWRRLEEGRFFA